MDGLASDSTVTDACQADALIRKANALLKQPRSLVLALPLFKKAIDLEPDRLDIRLRFAKACWSLGDNDQARAVCQEVIARSPEATEGRLLHAIFWFPFAYETETQLATCRDAYGAEIAALSHDIEGSAAAASRLAGWADRIYPYYLPYQGLNAVELQRIYGRLMCRAMGLTYPEYAVARSRCGIQSGRKLRIGIVSQHFYTHSNWLAITAGWMAGLDPGRFEIHAYHLSGREDDCTATAKRLAHRFVDGERSFEAWCREITSDRLDVLLYPAIGSHSLVTKLAMLRLAPVQCLTAGHCVTSGFPTMDYFLSGELTEPPDAASHYTEALVRLPGLGIRYTEPSVQPPVRTRDSFGLRASTCVFLSPNSPVKYLPQHDVLYARIAARLPDAQIVFVRHPRLESANRTFEQRMRRVFREEGADWDRHAVVLPRLNRQDYNDLQCHSDVYLDSIGWNGGTTSATALGYHLPMVTLTGPVFRGRMGTAMLQLLDLPETIASTPEEYVEIAVRLGSDAALRQDLQRRIATNKYRIYSDAAVPAGFAAFLEHAAARNS